MRTGTKSVLFGAHAFWLHPWFVALAWWKLFGFPWDPRLWVAFFVHDLGYFGKPNMDGPEGETHPYWAANVMYRLFDVGVPRQWTKRICDRIWGDRNEHAHFRWYDFVLYHSRFLAKRDRAQPSLLCVADKLAVALEPWWLYLPRVIATGEIREYMSLAAVRDPASKYAGEPPTKYESMGLDLSSRRAWFLNMTDYLRRWAYEHRDGRADTWTPDQRKARDESGVWS